jgi:hypothetical protein
VGLPSRSPYSVYHVQRRVCRTHRSLHIAQGRFSTHPIPSHPIRRARDGGRFDRVKGLRLLPTTSYQDTNAKSSRREGIIAWNDSIEPSSYRSTS